MLPSVIGTGGPNGIVLPRLISPRRVIGSRTFDFDRQVAVMAIVNRTPDSFHDQGRTFALDQAVAAVNMAVADGPTGSTSVGCRSARTGPTSPRPRSSTA